MTTADTQRGVLIFGRRQLVLDETVAGLRDLGFEALGTNDFFSDVAGRFDIEGIDLVSFGLAVPPDRKAKLRSEIAAINPEAMFIDSPGIPEVIIGQVQDAFRS